jgi:hypothetical protein
MSFTVKAMCQHGELAHRRKTIEAALRKAREMFKSGCYDLHIVTPEGRESSEFADIPRTSREERPVAKAQIHPMTPSHQRVAK